MGDGRKLFVAKLPKDIEEDEMDQIFSTYGTVEEVVLMDPSRSNKPDERTGFVIYKTVEAAGIAVEVLNGVYRFREESVEPIHVSFARGKAGKGKDSKGDKGDGRGDRKGDRKGDGKGKDKSDKSYNESYSHNYNDRNDRQFHDRDSHRRSFGGGRGHEAPASSPGSASRPVYRGDGGSQIRERSRTRGDAGASYAAYAPREEFRGSDFGRERERERDERDRYPPREQSRFDRYRGEQREREYESRNPHDNYDRREGNFREDRYRSDRSDRPDRPERGRPDRQERSDHDRRPERFDDRGHGYGGSGHGGHGGHDRGYRNEAAYRPPPGDDRNFKEDRRGSGPGSASKIYVGNLPSDVSKEVLQRVFSTYGPVEDIHIMTGRSKSGQASAFVKYFGTGEASDAISAMKQGYEIRPGQGLLQVRLADGEAPKGGGRGGDRSRPY